MFFSKKVQTLKAIIAIDSFKGSLTSLEAAKAVAEGIKRVYPDSFNKVFPIADGGEGPVDAVVCALSGKKIAVNACDPLGRDIVCEYGMVNGDTAVIEMSCAAGITLLSKDERNPLETTTYGVGQVIKHAVLGGCRNFVIGIGGSATNDGGIGMLQALGFKILDKNGNPVPKGAKGLKDICSIDVSDALPELSECTFNIACDVSNPLCGDNGCSAVYGTQKGADANMIKDMDLWLSRYADIVKGVVKDSDRSAKGAGAAGGIGFAFMSFLRGRLCSGINLILDLIKLEDDIKNADIVITGEGRLDSQSIYGKVPVGVASLAKKYNKPVIAFCGSTDSGSKLCNDFGIDASQNLADTCQQVFRLIKAVKP